jgi:hypothetical protein
MSLRRKAIMLMTMKKKQQSVIGGNLLSDTYSMNNECSNEYK